jgi:HKD family nuclease
MTYCASLSFFEYALLKSLENAGVATITVLMDAASHQASFCDYVTGAGVRYRIHPVRLHPRAGVFHPKLYLMVSSKRVRLLIASANLTPSGFKSNLEIVDQLELTDENQADAHAFAQYTGMLRSLAGFDVSLPIAVIDELRRVADIVEERILKEPESESGPWFLHSIDEALLPQLVRLVSTDVVRQIVAFSPFFDKDCEAILGLAAAYPKADIRIIKDKEPDDLEGKPLAKLDKRITVEELQESDSEKRHLHAKVLLLRGKSAEWIVSGSANLTRSAWLAAANSKNFGNVEAIVVRAVNKGSMARLLKSIKTTPLDCRKLRWISSSGNDN